MAVVTIGEGSDLDGAPVGDVDAVVVAVRRGSDGVEPHPDRSRVLAGGEAISAIERPDRLRLLEESARPSTDND
jgi:hypothetical protein